jgi:predicted nucleic acid-binding Zn ribbon protein
MRAPDSVPQVPAAVERSAVVASPQPVCAVCGGPRDSRKRETCSGKCRTALSRRRRTEAEQTRDREVRALLKAALERLTRNEGEP